jgi:hypothetical protein
VKGFPKESLHPPREKSESVSSAGSLMFRKAHRNSPDGALISLEPLIPRYPTGPQSPHSISPLML